MAVRNKTIEYAFPLSTADVASNTARDFTATTIFIPETTSRTFRSVVLEVFVHDNGAAASLTAVLMGISLGAVARSDQTITQTITNSGENQSFIFTRDVTDYFVTNWTGTSMSAGCRLTMSVGTRNATAKLIITYEYDDESTTQIKTVRIPIEGNTGNLTTSLASIGGIANQLPALDTFLPEASKVYRDIFFEVWAHTGQTAGTTDRALNMRYNGTTTVSATYECGLTSDYPIKRIDKISGSFNTNTAYSIEASTANTDTPFPCLSGILYVTYEFDASTTTSVMNSLWLPIIDEDGYTPSGSAFLDRYVKNTYIQEPDTISLEQSSLLFTCIDAGATTADIRIGAQTSRTYAHPDTVRCGALYMMRRFDAGAAEDSGITLARGKNDIQVDYFSRSATAGSRGSNASGVLILNYKSGKSSQGIGAHNHTTCWNARQYTAAAANLQTIFTASTTPVIPEDNYWITCNGLELKLLTTGGAAGTLATAFQAQIDPSEPDGAGWFNYYSSMYNSDAEIGPSVMWNTCKRSFKQFPEDTIRIGRIFDEETPRTYRYDQLTAIGYIQVQKYLTYHSITCSIAGTVTNFTPSGFITATNTVECIIYNSLGDPLDANPLATAIDNGTGEYSFIWYDDTNQAQVTWTGYIYPPFQDGQLEKSGVSSKQIISGSTFNINFDTGSSPGPTSTYYSYA